MARPDGGEDAVARAAAYAAALLAFASAATTACWVLGGTALLDTVGGYAEDLARSRTATSLLVGLLVFGVKVAGSLLALALVHPRGPGWLRRSVLLLSGAGGLLLTVYGGLLVVVGLLVLTGVIDPGQAVDRRALTWHVALWDLWFLLWGLALLVATWRSRVRRSGGARSASPPARV